MGYQLSDLLQLMARLRDPDTGCPWDREQTMRSVVPHTLEECYELIDAIEHDALDQVRDELGDVLFQVVFYAQLGAEQGVFDFDTVVDGIVRKLLRRHPHVFPDGTLHSHPAAAAVDVAVVHERWETIKQQERQSVQQAGILDDVPVALPALLRAGKIQRRVARVGFDWDNTAAVLAKLDEELAELRQAMAGGSKADQEAELGDLLFSVVNLSRHLDIDPEGALRQTNQRFEQRFRHMEATAAQRKVNLAEMNLAELDQLWDAAKKSLGK